ncbi:phosphatidate cytidylyltransferase [Qipengyuania sp. NPDC077563]|uniref:phosphatidate cytidylyltransferase n=1 Tax=Qipengyuania sp. NPDC077563 TaxID=3364497 RepID=UPI00384C9D06
MGDGEAENAPRKRDALKERARRYMTVPLSVRTSDLPVRIASAVVMLAVAVGAVIAGDPWLDAFIAFVALATLTEFLRLVPRATSKFPFRFVSLVGGTLYIGSSGYVLTQLPVTMIVGVVGAVIFVDSFAYGFGRTLGGPKIAPRISPSKTWAGLLGGIVGASVWLSIFSAIVAPAMDSVVAARVAPHSVFSVFCMGAIIAIAAQSGDFLESWLKRKAGVKDSSNLIPGHGGFFDRTDGIIPVVLLAGLFLNSSL